MRTLRDNTRFPISSGTLLTALTVFMPYSATQAQSPVLTTLYRFTDQNGDGAGPTAGVVVAKSGLLYGTTATGGSSNYGTVFELKPPVSPSKVWTETVLYSLGPNLAWRNRRFQFEHRAVIRASARSSRAVE